MPERVWVILVDGEREREVERYEGRPLLFDELRDSLDDLKIVDVHQR